MALEADVSAEREGLLGIERVGQNARGAAGSPKMS
jgi:hypothetical protein